MKCPKCGYVRQERDNVFSPPTECPACGVVYAKYLTSENSAAFGMTETGAGSKRQSPVHEETLKRARDRVERRLRKKINAGEKDEYREQTLQRARMFVSEGIKKRREEMAQRKTKEQETDRTNETAAGDDEARKLAFTDGNGEFLDRAHADDIEDLEDTLIELSPDLAVALQDETSEEVSVEPSAESSDEASGEDSAEPSIEFSEEAPEEMPIEPSVEFSEEAPEETPIEPSAELSAEAPEETPVELSAEAFEEAPIEPSAELLDEAPEEAPVEPSAELSEEASEEAPVEPSVELLDEAPEEVPVEPPTEWSDEAPEAPVEPSAESPDEASGETSIASLAGLSDEATEEASITSLAGLSDETHEETSVESSVDLTDEAPGPEGEPAQQAEVETNESTDDGAAVIQEAEPEPAAAISAAAVAMEAGASTVAPDATAMPEAAAPANVVVLPSKRPEGLMRLLPAVAWLVLVLGVFGAILSWTTMDSVRPGVNAAEPWWGSGGAIALLLGFAYLATGVLGFAFFWVGSMINTHLRELHMMLLQPLLANQEVLDGMQGAAASGPRGDEGAIP